LEFARDLGFSEFYAAEPQVDPFAPGALKGLPEHAPMLRTLPDVPLRPTPQVVAVDGEWQLQENTESLENLASPSVTPEQVAANARARRATLSVSWLNKSDLALHWAAQVTGSTHAGVRARPDNWRIARTIMVCEDEARAEAAVMSDDSPCRSYYSKMTGLDASSAEVDALIADCVLYGSLQTVLDGVHDIAATATPFGTLTLVDHVWPDADLARQSMASLASALAPISLCNRASN